MSSEIELKQQIEGMRRDMLMALERERQLGKTVAELKRWKKEAIEVWPDMQKIGELLELPCGETISDKIIPGIIKLKNDLERKTNAT